jgi:hypothetical protein
MIMQLKTEPEVDRAEAAHEAAPLPE